MIALLFALLRLSSGALLQGHIRSSIDGAPLGAALVELLATDSSGTHFDAYSDSLGAYAFPQLSPGSYRLRVSRVGYDARNMQVLLPDSSAILVDIALKPRPARLPSVRVFATDRAGNADTPKLDDIADQDVGSVVLRGEALHDDPALPNADALQSFAARGAASTRDEVATSMHVHGGAASENAVLLDGIPLFNPYHASGTLLAVDPDILASATLHSGAPGAALGDVTGSIVELETVPAGAASFSTMGAYGGHAARASIAAPLSATGGSVLVAARHNIDAPLADGHDASHSGVSFDDLLARATVPLRGGELEAFAFHSGDRLGFDAQTESSADREGAAGLSLQRALTSNTMSWNTGTDALRWRSGGARLWELRAWRTGFDSRFDWAGGTRLHSSYEQLGLSASSVWYLSGLQLTSGVDVDRLNVGYSVQSRADSAAKLLALSGAPLLVSAVTEAQGSLGERWSYAFGVRDPVFAPGATGLEPRASIRFAATPHISLGLGYSRLHQYVQSLRNEESLVDELTGIALPAVAGSSANGATVPVARADQIAATIEARLSSTLILSAVGYTRRETGLVLVAPASAEPFATSDFATGTAQSRGLSLSLARSGKRVFGELSYSLSSVTQGSGSAAYTPEFAAAHSIALGAGVRVDGATTLRAAASVHSGASANSYTDPIEWMPYTPASGSGDLSGSPQHIVGALDGSRLPPYFRLDLGVRRDWRVNILGMGARLSGSASVVNVLGRSNAAGLIALGDGTTRRLLLPPRSLELGLEWRH